MVPPFFTKTTFFYQLHTVISALFSLTRTFVLSSNTQINNSRAISISSYSLFAPTTSSLKYFLIFSLSKFFKTRTLYHENIYCSRCFAKKFATIFTICSSTAPNCSPFENRKTNPTASPLATIEAYV